MFLFKYVKKDNILVVNELNKMYNNIQLTKFVELMLFMKTITDFLNMSTQQLCKSFVFEL